jgi:SNF2 family DNA or RNA helicase
MIMTTAGSTGLNLQAGNAVVIYDLLWNPKSHDQFIGRVVRLGNNAVEVPVINIIAKNTIEEYILAKLANKSNMFDAVMTGDVEGLISGTRTNIFSELLEMLEV